MFTVSMVKMFACSLLGIAGPFATRHKWVIASLVLLVLAGIAIGE